MKTVVTVKGMTCQNCVRHVTEAIQELPSVSGVTIDLESGRVDIESTTALDPNALNAAVDEAGYEVVS